MSNQTRLTVGAVVITRNRPDLLRKTLRSLQQSVYPLGEITVSDDSTDDSTAQMLAVEFPGVIWLKGPQRGRSANRNNGIKAVRADYILVSDDDIIVDPTFVGSSMQHAATGRAGMFFAATSEFGRLILPNALDFLGFSTKRYSQGAHYTTANSHCFILAREVAEGIAYDEVIEVYGYEEMDFAYRTASSGFPIHCVPTCANIHLAPIQTATFRPEKDASRLYVAFKRHAYVDRRPLAATAFLCVAIPHHLLASVRQSGSKGLFQALSNFRLAATMLWTFRQSVVKNRAVAVSAQSAQSAHIQGCARN